MHKGKAIVGRIGWTYSTDFPEMSVTILSAERSEKILSCDDVGGMVCPASCAPESSFNNLFQAFKMEDGK
jgi:hypothetical protein